MHSEYAVYMHIQLADFKRGLDEEKVVVYLRGVDTPMHTGIQSKENIKYCFFVLFCCFFSPFFDPPLIDAFLK